LGVGTGFSHKNCRRLSVRGLNAWTLEDLRLAGAFKRSHRHIQVRATEEVIESTSQAATTATVCSAAQSGKPWTQERTSTASSLSRDGTKYVPGRLHITKSKILRIRPQSHLNDHGLDQDLCENYVQLGNDLFDNLHVRAAGENEQ